MGCHKGGTTLPPHQTKELGKDRIGGCLVKVPGRLVGEDERRLVGERPRNGDPLLLASGKLRRPVIETSAKAKRCQQLLRATQGSLGFGTVD